MTIKWTHESINKGIAMAYSGNIAGAKAEVRNALAKQTGQGNPFDTAISSIMEHLGGNGSKQ